VNVTPHTAAYRYELELTAEERAALVRALARCTIGAEDALFQALPEDEYEALAGLRDAL
jgi:hypothetical protein